MTQPAVTSSNPSNNDTDVFLNIPLTATFNVALLASSVTETSCILINAATDDPVSTNVSYTPGGLVITLTPYGVLEENTVYKIKFLGTDLAISSNDALKDSGGEALTTTITIVFTTGTKTKILDSATEKETVNLSLEGDITLPWNVKALGVFVVSGTYPKNGAADVDPTLGNTNQVWIQFNKNLSGSLCNSGWLDIDMFPILDNTAWLASGSSFGAGTIPNITGVWCSGSFLYAGFSTELPKNLGVNIIIDDNVTSFDGNEFGPSDYNLSFSTERYPSVAGTNIMKREVKAASDELTDEYIASTLFKNTIKLLHKYSFDYNSPSWFANRFVVAASIIDILDDVELEKAIVAGSRRQLGDLLVSVDNTIGKLAVKHARAEKELEKLDKVFSGKKLLINIIQEAFTSAYYDRPSRLWFNVSGKIIDNRFKKYQPNLPVANVTLTRQAKIGSNSPYFLP